jgi:hypothetical protein
MKPQTILQVGEQYSKKELSSLLNEPTLQSVREGVFSCRGSASYLLFVDLEKADKETRFHFDDFFEGDYFHWDSQTTQHLNSPKIQELIQNVLTPYLFVRIKQKEKSKTLPFIYCGRLSFHEHEQGTANPAHIIFQNIDYDDFTINPKLLEVYNWKPSSIGKTTKSKINKSGSISHIRQSKYRRPNETERSGLITSRVGQGYFRQQILEKWNGICAVSGTDVISILIASHIVPWSECTDNERLDVENGILLSPVYDALFDKYLISFDASGKIIISDSLNPTNKEKLGLSDNIKINITKGMLTYLKRHNNKLFKMM